MKNVAYKKFGKQDQKLLVAWAPDCAEHTLPSFEKAYPNDDRPRQTARGGRFCSRCAAGRLWRRGMAM